LANTILERMAKDVLPEKVSLNKDENREVIRDRS